MPLSLETIEATGLTRTNENTAGPVVERLDNAIHRINHYPVRLDSDLSGG